MTATNHALTGAIIGLVIGEPILAIPLAFVSHFICDALPHFGSQDPNDGRIKTKGFRNYLILDASLCFLLVAILFMIQPSNWLLAAICAFLAASPDFGWINRFIKAKSGKTWKPNLYSKFAINIQWFQRPVGAVVEAAWFIASVIIIVPFLR